MPALETDMLSLIVAHGGQSYPVELPASSTIEELQARLDDLTSVPIAGQKLIHKGKNLAAQPPTTLLSSLSIPSGARLLLVGSSPAAASAVAADHAALQRRYELSQSRQGVKPRTTAEGGKMVMDFNSLRSSKTFERFGKIEVLPGCPHEELRRERLRKLSIDEAVLACMKTRDWQVGLLSELHPKRDPTLLGLNKNAGEAVFLRILTDELDGLRSYAHTRMVLLHELTHNKHGDHDEQFKTLNSLLNKEVKAYEEAQRAGSHRLGGDIAGAYDPEAAAEVEEMCGSGGGGQGADGQPSGSSSSSRTRRSRNHEQQEDGAWEMEQRRRAMLAAAEARSKAAGSSSSARR